MADHYHFIGIGGIGMSGLAQLLLSKKQVVTGSDIAFSYTIESLNQAGAVVHRGQAAEHILPHMKVVYSTDIKPDNPEYQAALKLGCPLLHRSDLLAELLVGSQALAVAGTHGKTTTSALLATVLVEAGKDPSFAIGGILPAFQSNARFGEGEMFAFEADESDGTFLKYFPFGAIVTNIDKDHLNAFAGQEEQLVQAFKTFMTQVQSPSHLFWCGEDAHLVHLNAPGQSYGYGAHCEWQIQAIEQKGFKIFFDLIHQKNHYKQIEVALSGKHNALNAAAVFGLALTLGIAEERIRQAFKTFKGVLRRCEIKGSFNEILFLDDYAHHPTEIETTLQGIRRAIGPRRLLAVFQPHRYSRTKDCLGTYGSIFDCADELIITDIYAAGETPLPQISHELIQQEVQKASSLSCTLVPRSALTHCLSRLVQPHDVVVTLGAGDITKVGPDTLALLEKQPPRLLQIGWIANQKQTHDPFMQNMQATLPAIYQSQAFTINAQGQWQKQEASPSSKEEGCKISKETFQQLMQCDVFIALEEGLQEKALPGFLMTLGKAYVGSDPEIISVNHLLKLEGISILTTPATKRLTYIVFDQQPSEWFSSSEEWSPEQVNQGKELAQKIYQILDCPGQICICLGLDAQQNLALENISPLMGSVLLTLLQKRAPSSLLNPLIIHALQRQRETQRKKMSEQKLIHA